MIADAFNALLSIHSREVKLRRAGIPDKTIRISPSNFSRQLAGPAEIQIEGKEFVISKQNLGTWKLKRGDLILDPDMGGLSIVNIDGMYDFGGGILGYRVRTG